MIVSTTIDLTPEVYQYFMNTARNIPVLSAEELMSMALTLYISMRQTNLPMGRAEWDKFDRLVQDGTLKNLL